MYTSIKAAKQYDIGEELAFANQFTLTIFTVTYKGNPFNWLVTVTGEKTFLVKTVAGLGTNKGQELYRQEWQLPRVVVNGILKPKYPQLGRGWYALAKSGVNLEAFTRRLLRLNELNAFGNAIMKVCRDYTSLQMAVDVCNAIYHNIGNQVNVDLTNTTSDDDYESNEEPKKKLNCTNDN